MGYKIFKTFLQRRTSVKFADEFINAPLDFTVDEEMIVDREVAKYAKTPAEGRGLWRKNIRSTSCWQLRRLRRRNGNADKGQTDK